MSEKESTETQTEKVIERVVEKTPDFEKMSTKEAFGTVFPGEKGESKLEGEWGESSALLVKDFNIPAEVADAMLESLKKTIKIKEKEDKAAAKTSEPAESSKEEAVKFAMEAENAKYLIEYAKQYNKDLAQFQLDIEKGVASKELLEKCVTIMKAQEKTASEGDSSVNINFGNTEDKVTEANAIDIRNDIIQNNYDALYNTENPNHKKIRAKYDQATKAAGLPVFRAGEMV